MDVVTVPITVAEEEEEDNKTALKNGFESGMGATDELEEAEEVKVCLPTPEKFADSRPTVKTKVEGFLDSLGEKIGHRCLVLLAMVLSVLLVLLVFLLVWPRVPHHVLATKCSRPHCLRAAAMYVETMNSSIDPCIDPWQWACGNWLNESVTKQRGNWGKRDELWLQELTKVRDIVSSMTELGGPDSVNWKLKTLYESCMAVEDIEGDHDNPLKKLIFELGE